MQLIISYSISSIYLALSDLARASEQLIIQGIDHPGSITLLLVFVGGVLTSLGPCTLSLMPITIGYLAGFESKQGPFTRSLSFCTGIVFSLVFLGMLSGLFGKVYGQIPISVPKAVALITILMGLNLIGIIKIPLAEGPNPQIWQEKVPKRLAPIAAGSAFGLASSPCTTPVLAVLLTWSSQSANPLIGIILLTSFGFGQVLPLIIAGTTAASIKNFLALRPISRWITPVSGVVFITSGLLSLLSQWL